MLSKIHNIKLSIGFLFVIILMFVGIGIVRPADHGDTPLLKQISRSDARLTDLFAMMVNRKGLLNGQKRAKLGVGCYLRMAKTLGLKSLMMTVSM